MLTIAFIAPTLEIGSGENSPLENYASQLNVVVSSRSKSSFHQINSSSAQFKSLARWHLDDGAHCFWLRRNIKIYASINCKPC